MSDKDTGGPAFPGLHPSKECHYQETGMTLRDYFAAKAMQALVTKCGAMEDDMCDPQAMPMADEDAPNVDQIAVYSYAQADAMLEARK